MKSTLSCKITIIIREEKVCTDLKAARAERRARKEKDQLDLTKVSEKSNYANITLHNK